MLIIYGASDDLVEIEGDIREEFSLPGDDKMYIATSNGFVIEVIYDGDWKMMPRQTPNTTGGHYDYYPAGTKEAVYLVKSDYTDVIVLKGDFEWIVGGSNYVRTRY